MAPLYFSYPDTVPQYLFAQERSTFEDLVHQVRLGFLLQLWCLLWALCITEEEPGGQDTESSDRFPRTFTQILCKNIFPSFPLYPLKTQISAEMNTILTDCCYMQQGCNKANFGFFLFYFFLFFGQMVRHVGSYFPRQELSLCLLQGRHSVLTPGLPGNSQEDQFISHPAPRLKWHGIG